MATLVPLFPGIPGGIEVFVVLLIIVLLFGANKLPKLARSSGQAMGEFKKGREEVEQELAEMQGQGAEEAESSEPTTTETTPSTATEETVETEKQN
ncbi:twin-arginine translocase TatA/TatE family subunit [Halomarina oriensis]|uniref:Sec-independent protein translocase protein TatA n=1 Tax=Halomarina oriensis TaxID=671145 RepID=A0A6B0GS53_9EURY|nr:twin-arginine translocase TatA/TatE family subunit [Halomarina oriensis]MWG36137.1 twin-arginine translocase TatA/TatE family subunit [Halomarina oriensis]